MPKFSRRAIAAFAAAVATRPATAQTVHGPVRIIVPYNPGGITDILARAVAQQMTAQLGTSVVVENRAGAKVLTRNK